MEAVAAVQARIVSSVQPTGLERVGLTAARGRVLGVPVVSERRVPDFDNSAMDGYALRAADLEGARPEVPRQLEVIGESRAGHAPTVRVRPGTAVRIMTGAPLPAGADTVVRHEDTDNGRRQVQVRVAAPRGRDVRCAGEDMVPGTRILEPGRVLRSHDLAACAAVGRVELEVYRRPRVALLSTGDELVEPDREPVPGQVVDSNGVALAAAVEEAGGLPVRLGIVPDDVESLTAALRRAARCDLVVTTAGVSVGDHDHVRDVVSAMGRIDVWRVAMRPGKPVAVGIVGGVPFLGLPGNPVSSQVTFELFARPAIRALQGDAVPLRRRTAARALERMTTPASLEVYGRGVLEDPPAGSPPAVPGVRLTGPQGSGMMSSLVRADCLVVLGIGTAAVEVGDIVEVLAFR